MDAEGATATDDARRKYVKDLAHQAQSAPVRATIRELISHWGAKRRGVWNVEQITRTLRQEGLEVIPPLSDGLIDDIVLIRVAPPDPRASASGASGEDDDANDTSRREVALRVDQIPSAAAGVKSIKTQDTLLTAESEMMRYDYSQLAVMDTPHSRPQAVSWESISRARVRNRDAELADALIARPTVVPMDADLLAVVPTVTAAGFVFVEDRNRTLSGIVTPADLSDKFVELARPFLMLGEIERLMRLAIDRHFDAEHLAAVAEADDDVDVGVDGLTFGGYLRLLEEPSRWERLGWNVERKVFIEALDELRMIRNEVMHFSPDPLGASELTKLQRFIEWVRVLEPSSLDCGPEAAGMR